MDGRRAGPCGCRLPPPSALPGPECNHHPTGIRRVWVFNRQASLYQNAGAWGGRSRAGRHALRGRPAGEACKGFKESIALHGSAQNWAGFAEN